MKIALLYNLNRGVTEHDAEFDSQGTIDKIVECLTASRHVVELVEATRDLVSWIIKLDYVKPDLVFNIAEGFVGAARESVHAAILEQLGMDYSGPGSTELLVCHNKAIAKRLLEQSGVKMAKDYVISNTDDLEALSLYALPFPLIVKLNSEGSSLGMDDKCIVEDFESLRCQVVKVLDKYGTNIIVEQYIRGRDLSTNFVEGIGVCPPVEYIYPEGQIYDYRLKTSANHVIEVATPSLDSATESRIMKDTGVVAKVFDLNGYGRADFRLSEDNELYFLEMNAQVSFHPIGAFVLSAARAGYNMQQLLEHIVRHAKNTKRRTSAIGKFMFTH